MWSVRRVWKWGLVAIFAVFFIKKSDFRQTKVITFVEFKTFVSETVETSQRNSLSATL